MTIQKLGPYPARLPSDLLDVEELIGQNPAFLVKIIYSRKELENGWKIHKVGEMFWATRTSSLTNAARDAGLYPSVVAASDRERLIYLQQQYERHEAFQERMAILAGVPRMALPRCS